MSTGDAGALVIGIGNPLRGDDGVAHRVLELLDGGGVALLAVHQLLPEMAPEIAGLRSVTFVDADLTAAEATLTRMDEARAASPIFGHSFGPAGLVGLSRRLYGFAGAAFVCRVPVKTFEAGWLLSGRAQAGATRAALLITSAFADARLRQPGMATAAALKPARPG